MDMAELSASCRYQIVHGSQVSAPQVNGMRMSRRIFYIQSNQFSFHEVRMEKWHEQNSIHGDGIYNLRCLECYRARI